MKQISLFVGIVLGFTDWSLGAMVVARGSEMYIWLEDAVGPSYQLRFGYHDPSGQNWADPTTIIGDDVWFTQPGTYDFSGDPQFSGFLSYATNGTSDRARLRIFDQYDLRLFLYMTEAVWLGQFPDLAPLTVTGAQLHVLEITPQSDGVQLLIQMEYLGIPEPASVLLAAGMACIIKPKRDRGRLRPSG